jgi:hypothetical protein
MRSRLILLVPMDAEQEAAHHRARPQRHDQRAAGDHRRQDAERYDSGDERS